MKNHSPSGCRIPDKLYFRIGEVAAITGLETYVLRFWESEFPLISPKRTPSGQRLYRKSDVESVLKIKHLLYDRKFTIPGAKNYLKRRKKDLSSTPADLEEIRAGLEEIRTLLE